MKPLFLVRICFPTYFCGGEAPSSEIETFQYTRHIFGAKSSPTFANFVVQQTARDNVKSFPVASKAVFTSFYVNDFLQSVPCERDAVALASQLLKMLTKGGYNLTKIVTNSLEVYKLFDKDITFAKPSSEMEVTTILGIQWDLKKDKLYVCRGVSNPLPGNITQRKTLSVVSSVFCIRPFRVCPAFHYQRSFDFERTLAVGRASLGHACP